MTNGDKMALAVGQRGRALHVRCNLSYAKLFYLKGRISYLKININEGVIFFL